MDFLLMPHLQTCPRLLQGDFWLIELVSRQEPGINAWHLGQAIYEVFDEANLAASRAKLDKMASLGSTLNSYRDRIMKTIGETSLVATLLDDLRKKHIEPSKPKMWI